MSRMKLTVILIGCFLFAHYSSDAARPAEFFQQLLFALVSPSGNDGMEEQPEASGLQDTLQNYWDSVYSQVSHWVEAVCSTPTGQYIKGAFTNGTAAISTYSRILWDQITHSV